MLINNTIKLKVYEAIEAQLIQNKQLIINSLCKKKKLLLSFYLHHAVTFLPLPSVH